MRILIVIFSALLLSACSTLSGTGTSNAPTPTPLANFQRQYTPMLLWRKSIGGDQNSFYLHLQPNVAPHNISELFVASTNKEVYAVNTQTGKTLWRTEVATKPTSGPAVGNGMLVVAGKKNQLFALDQSNGKLLWKTTLPNQALASPSISQGRVFIHTVNDDLVALSSINGQGIWQYAHQAPVLILTGGAAPTVYNQQLYVGYADGNLAAFSPASGALIWQRLIAQPKGSSSVQQMVDIAADIQFQGNMAYVVTYQGNLAALNATTGQLVWQYPLSSYTGMAVTQNSLFVTDTAGDVLAFDRHSGQLLWEQKDLRYRLLTKPVAMGNTIVIGDGQGYLHWLSKATGVTVARVLVDKKDPIVVPPVVAQNNVYVLTSEGYLRAYQLKTTTS